MGRDGARGRSASSRGRRVAAIRRALLQWYDAHRRDLPWRRGADPYRVWVSEVMLQQTRVETVVPYYARWLGRFPDVRALADAETEDVLAAWAGLGYYRRARALHDAARIVRDRHGGELPREVETLRTLPGVGPYTAGAIASIAHGRRAPAIDGNARRVLARLFDVADPPRSRLEAWALALVRTARPGDLNQALMELGAVVCTPRSPACGRCPVAGWCLAWAHGTVARRPARPRRRPRQRYRVGTAVLVLGGRVLVARRPAGGMLGGLWELPGAFTSGRERPAAAARRVCRALLGRAPRGRLLVVVDHLYSHRRHVYHAYRFDLEPDASLTDEVRTPVPIPAVHGAAAWTELAWREIDRLPSLPKGAAQRRIAGALAWAP